MKKFACLLVIVGVLGFLAFTPAEAGACGRWVLYDDFDSGIIDPSLWEIFGPGTITVEDEMLKIVQSDTPAGTNTGLRFKMNPERIKEVKVMAMVQSSTGDLHTRVGGRIGKDQDGTLIFKRIAIRPDPTMLRIDCWTGTDGPGYDIHYTYFESPLPMGVFYEMGINLNRRFFTSWVKGLGKNYYIPNQRILRTSEPLYLQIGTRSGGESPDTASGVVWFDNVYVRY